MLTTHWNALDVSLPGNDGEMLPLRSKCRNGIGLDTAGRDRGNFVPLTRIALSDTGYSDLGFL